MIIPRLFFLKDDEQLLVESFTARKVINGPGRYLAQPFERVTRRQAIILGSTDYLHTRHTLTGELKSNRGPKLYFLDANEKIEQALQAFPLQIGDYVRILNTETGQIRVVRGETTVYLEPNETLDGDITGGIVLDDRTGVLVRDVATGEQTVITGTQIFTPSATQEIVETRRGINIDERNAVLVRDITTGQLSLVRENQVFIPSATQEVVEIRKGINIDEKTAVLVRNITSGQQRLIREKQVYIPDENHEIVSVRQGINIDEKTAVLIRDTTSGQLSLIREKQVFFAEPTQEIVEIRQGVNVDEKTAVLVRDITNGQLTLVTEKQVFIPSATQEIVEVRDLIRLEDQQTVIIKDREGRYIFRHGSDTSRSFFLQPYEELVTLWWSSGIHKDRRELRLTHIDKRPKYMWYDFDVRTQDNVELVIGLTFFWQVVDVEAMIKMTDDTTGDVSSHARSTIIQAVSRATLERFLAAFNHIVGDAVLGNTDDAFYRERGVQIHAVEVRSVACKDPETQRILMEIIQETTNRLNRLQKQESENEVKLRRLQGDIETENTRGQLLSIQRDHARVEALTMGESESEKVRIFLEGLGSNLSMDQKIAIFNTLRKGEVLASLAKGNANLYFTPNDVDLKING